MRSLPTIASGCRLLALGQLLAIPVLLIAVTTGWWGDRAHLLNGASFSREASLLFHYTLITAVLGLQLVGFFKQLTGVNGFFPRHETSEGVVLVSWCSWALTLLAWVGELALVLLLLIGPYQLPSIFSGSIILSLVSLVFLGMMSQVRLQTVTRCLGLKSADRAQEIAGWLYMVPVLLTVLLVVNIVVGKGGSYWPVHPFMLYGGTAALVLFLWVQATAQKRMARALVDVFRKPLAPVPGDQPKLSPIAVMARAAKFLAIGFNVVGIGLILLAGLRFTGIPGLWNNLIPSLLKFWVLLIGVNTLPAVGVMLDRLARQKIHRPGPGRLRACVWLCLLSIVAAAATIFIKSAGISSVLEEWAIEEPGILFFLVHLGLPVTNLLFTTLLLWEAGLRQWSLRRVPLTAGTGLVLVGLLIRPCGLLVPGLSGASASPWLLPLLTSILVGPGMVLQARAYSSLARYMATLKETSDLAGMTRVFE